LTEQLVNSLLLLQGGKSRGSASSMAPTVAGLQASDAASIIFYPH